MKCCVSTRQMSGHGRTETFKLDPDYSTDAGTGLLSPISYKHWDAEFNVGKIICIHIAGAPLQRGVVVKWFYIPPLQRGVVLHPATAARCGFTAHHRREAWYYSPPPQRGVVLHPATAARCGITARHRSEAWFYSSLSRRNAFVGDTCTLPSTLLVYIYDNSTT